MPELTGVSAGPSSGGGVSIQWDDVGSTGFYRSQIRRPGDDWTRPVGRGNRRLSLDGGYADAPDDASLDIAGSLSVSMWLNPSQINDFDTPFAKGACYVGTPDSDSANYGMGMVDGQLRFQLHDVDGNKSGAEATFDLSAGTWYHVVGTYDASTNEQVLYIDGVADDTVSGISADLVTNTHPVGIGRDPTRGESFNYPGLMADVRVYGRALSSAEVSTLSDGGEVDTTDLISAWNFAGTSSGTVPDAIGSNDATMSGTSSVGDLDIDDHIVGAQPIFGHTHTADILDGANYDWRARWEDHDEVSTWASGTTNSFLDQPTNVQTSVTESSVTITWDIVDNNPDGDVNVIYGESLGSIDTVIDTMLVSDPQQTTHDGRDPGTAYLYVIERDTGEATKETSATITVVTEIAAAGDFSIDNTDASGIVPEDDADFSWSDPNSNANGVDGWRLELSTDSGETWSQYGDDIDDNDTDFTATDLLDGQLYHARIIAFKGSTEKITE